MAKGVANASFISDLFQFGLYKPNQGKMVRQVTFATMAVTLLLGCWQLRENLRESYTDLQYIVPGVLLLAGGWLCFRLVNWPRFADFLISVEAELNKVSWPSRDEVIRSSIVVIFVIFVMAALLFGFDVFWRYLFMLINVVQTGGQS